MNLKKKWEELENIEDEKVKSTVISEWLIVIMAGLVVIGCLFGLIGKVIFSNNEPEPVESRTEIIFEVNDIPMVEEEVVEEPEVIEEEPVEEVYYEREMIQKSWEQNHDGLTASKGVNYYNGRKETYYSSNVLYHYRTPEWTVDEYGVYRDADGYVVVAASDLAQGSEVDTSFGMGKVYDSGCAAGTTDIYVAW